MKLEEFKSGIYKTQLRNQSNCQYKSFYPTMLNQEWIWSDNRINILLEEASINIAELNAFSSLIPNVNLFISMHINKEATYSTKIEGIKTELEDLFVNNNLNEEERNDKKEVENYIKALNFAVNKLEDIPICNRLLKETHKVLLQGVRGEKKYPGEFRTSQNWIGGSNLMDAYFIPPHQDDILDLMSDLEQFIHNENLNIPHLIKIAIIHYQFETIHPFCDGNGRLGRLLIILYLINFNILSKPTLYLSEFFEKHKNTYYQYLTNVRLENDIIRWILFFLNGIIETSKKAKNTFMEIIKLQNNTISILDNINIKHKKQLLDYLFQKPIVNVKEISNELNISFGTAKKLLDKFVEHNIIIKSQNLRNINYTFKTYLRLFK